VPANLSKCQSANVIIHVDFVLKEIFLVSQQVSAIVSKCQQMSADLFFCQQVSAK
jgi:hypothetical protein